MNRFSIEERPSNQVQFELSQIDIFSNTCSNYNSNKQCSLAFTCTFLKIFIPLCDITDSWSFKIVTKPFFNFIYLLTKHSLFRYENRLDFNPVSQVFCKGKGKQDSFSRFYQN